LKTPIQISQFEDIAAKAEKSIPSGSDKKYLILEKYNSKLKPENRGCPQGLRRDPLNLIWVMPA